MITPKIAKASKSQLAFAAYVLGMLCGAFLIWTALSDVAAEGARLATARERLEALQSRSHPARVADETYGRQAADQFLGGDRVTVAAAELQRRVAGEITRLGGAVVSSRIERSLSPETAGDIKLAVEFELAQADLGPLLYAVEASTPFIFVEKLGMRSRVETPDAETQPRLRVALLVSGAWREPKP